VSFDATLREEGSFSDCGDRSFGQAICALKRRPHAAGTASGGLPPLPICWAPYNGIASKRKKITTVAMVGVPSPCNSICRIDSASGLCLGCRRTLEEIADWPMLSNDEKRAVLREVERR
jgi:uncharacterized protein